MLRVGRSGDRNPLGGEIFHTLPYRPCGSPSLLYNRYRFFSPGVKWPVRGTDHPPSCSAEVKERVELYLYSPSGHKWPFRGCPLSLPIALLQNYTVIEVDMYRPTTYCYSSTCGPRTSLHKKFWALWYDPQYTNIWNALCLQWRPASGKEIRLSLISPSCSNGIIFYIFQPSLQ